jgi:hypothetical protein
MKTYQLSNDIETYGSEAGRYIIVSDDLRRTRVCELPGLRERASQFTTIKHRVKLVVDTRTTKLEKQKRTSNHEANIYYNTTGDFNVGI